MIGEQLQDVQAGRRLLEEEEEDPLAGSLPLTSPNSNPVTAAIATASGEGGNTHLLWGAVDPTLLSPLSCYCPLTVTAATATASVEASVARLSHVQSFRQPLQVEIPPDKHVQRQQVRAALWLLLLLPLLVRTLLPLLLLLLLVLLVLMLLLLVLTLSPLLRRALRCMSS